MKLSVILPVYNEEYILPYSLASIYDAVDEIVIIDGSPNGVSVDRTKEVIDVYGKDKIIYLDGTFRLPSGGLDEYSQKDVGLSRSSGDYVLFHSADVMYMPGDMAKTRGIIEDNLNSNLFYWKSIEFFENVHYLRLHPLDKFPSTIFGSKMIIKKSAIRYNPDRMIIYDAQIIHNSIFICDVYDYHYGWITPFEKQVEKHVKHVKQGLWGEHGDGLMRLGDSKIYSWAINHVLEYQRLPKYKYVGKLPVQDFTPTYLDGFKETISKYEATYGKSFYLEGGN